MLNISTHIPGRHLCIKKKHAQIGNGRQLHDRRLQLFLLCGISNKTEGSEDHFSDEVSESQRAFKTVECDVFSILSVND